MSFIEEEKKDEDEKKRHEEMIIEMGTPVYKHICHRMQLRERTLLDKYEISDLVVKDESVKLHLRFNCTKC